MVGHPRAFCLESLKCAGRYGSPRGAWVRFGRSGRVSGNVKEGRACRIQETGVINWMTECESKVGVRLEAAINAVCKAGARLKRGWVRGRGREAVAVAASGRGIASTTAQARPLPVRVRAPLDLCNFQHGFLYSFCSLLGLVHGLPLSSEPCSLRRLL